MNLKPVIQGLAAAGLIASASAYALPTLQLGIAGATYDNTTETSVATSNPFTLYAFLTPDKNNDLTDTYRIAIALTPQTSTAGNYGTFTIDGGTPIDVTADMVYGTPPLETIHDQLSDPGDLPTHGIYDTYFFELSFTFDGSNEAAGLDVQDNADLSGLDLSGSGMYYQTFEIDISGLADGYGLHFDLYNTAICTNDKGQCQVVGDIDQTQFAPFSHDASSGPDDGGDDGDDQDDIQISEPSPLALFGALLAVAGFSRRLRSKR